MHLLEAAFARINDNREIATVAAVVIALALGAIQTAIAYRGGF